MAKKEIDFVQIRSFLLANVNNIIENLAARKKDKENQSDDLFGFAETLESTKKDVWNFDYELKSRLDILQEEKNSLGLYVSGNPLGGYLELLKFVRRELKTKNIHLVVVEKIKKIFTRNGGMMIALQITNHQENLEGIIFPAKAGQFSGLLQEKKIYWVYGNIKQKSKIENQDEEVNQYDQTPKLNINGLSRIEEGPILALKIAEVENIDYGSLMHIHWLKLTQEPDLIKEFIKDNKISEKLLKAKEKTNLNISSNSTTNITVIKLRKMFGVKILNYIKQKLSKTEMPSYLPVEIQIETKDGEFKKVKGQYWLHSKIIEKIRELEKKLIL
jgi:DNA polymerase III alpha subunit